jgi:glycosyltransferase involved in cell wall biosynthesis
MKNDNIITVLDQSSKVVSTHFSIITPTIGRDTLLRTCETIDRQTCPDWEHLVIFDGPEQEVEVFKKIEHPQRKIIFSGNNFGDYGHSIRFFSYDFTKYDHMMYIDDDDYYHLECLGIIQRVMDSEVEFIFFPALWYASLLAMLPPRQNCTVSCQYVHRKKDRLGHSIRFPSGGHGTDNLWIGEMMKQYPYQVIETDCPLVYVDVAGDGKLDHQRRKPRILI